MLAQNRIVLPLRFYKKLEKTEAAVSLNLKPYSRYYKHQIQKVNREFIVFGVFRKIYFHSEKTSDLDVIPLLSSVVASRENQEKHVLDTGSEPSPQSEYFVVFMN